MERVRAVQLPTHLLCMPCTIPWTWHWSRFHVLLVSNWTTSMSCQRMVGNAWCRLHQTTASAPCCFPEWHEENLWKKNNKNTIIQHKLSSVGKMQLIYSHSHTDTHTSAMLSFAMHDKTNACIYVWRSAIAHDCTWQWQQQPQQQANYRYKLEKCLPSFRAIVAAPHHRCCCFHRSSDANNNSSYFGPLKMV